MSCPLGKEQPGWHDRFRLACACSVMVITCNSSKDLTIEHSCQGHCVLEQTCSVREAHSIPEEHAAQQVHDLETGHYMRPAAAQGVGLCAHPPHP